MRGLRFAGIVAAYDDGGCADQLHEEAIRDLLLAGFHPFRIHDVIGTPWIEIDYPTDIARARDDVLPRLTRLAEARTA